jgi:hypothetical protein
VSLASWFRASTISVASVTGVSSYGVPTFGPKRFVGCRLEAVRRMTRNTQGEEAISSHTIYTDQTILLTDRIWLPGVSTLTADGARSPVSVSISTDKSGTRSLTKVEL